MANLVHLIQVELDKINSTLQLLSIEGISPSQEHSFCAVVNNRYCCAEYSNTGYILLEIGEYDYLAGNTQTKDFYEIAIIIDLWIAQNKDIYSIMYYEVYIYDEYMDLLVLTNTELLEKQWNRLYEDVKKGYQYFDEVLFLCLKNKLFNLYPFLIHDSLCFSNIIGQQSDNFSTPYLYCKDNIFTIFKLNPDSSKEILFQGENIDEIVAQTMSLLPATINEAVNLIKQSSGN
jgi:hypothetical protein